MAKLPRYMSDAGDSHEWYESALELGLDAAEVPPDVYQAVIARQFTPEFDRFIDDFLGVAREATQEASNQIESELEQEYGPLEELTPQQLQRAERDLEQAERECFNKHWNRYRTRANRADPSFKKKLPRYKKEAAEWVAAACDAAARTLWEQKLKQVLTEPAEERLFMSFYTRQELFAGRLLGFDEVLTDFFHWMEMVQKLWLSCLVFEPDGPNAEFFRDVLTHLWRVYVILLPAWRERRRADEREKKQEQRRRQQSGETVSLEEDSTGPRSVLDHQQHRHWVEQPEPALDPDTAVLNKAELEETIAELEHFVARCNSEQQLIFRLLADDPDLTSADIAEQTGIPVRRVYYQRARLKKKLERLYEAKLNR